MLVLFFRAKFIQMSLIFEFLVIFFGAEFPVNLQTAIWIFFPNFCSIFWCKICPALSVISWCSAFGRAPNNNYPNKILCENCDTENLKQNIYQLLFSTKLLVTSRFLRKNSINLSQHCIKTYFFNQTLRNRIEYDY